MRPIAIAVFFLCASTAQSAAIYSYTGNPYTNIYNSVDNPAIGSAETTTPYDHGMLVSVELVLDQAASFNNNYYYIDGGLVEQGFREGLQLLSYSVSDGLITLNSDNSYIHTLELGIQNGDIWGWGMEVRSNEWDVSVTFQHRISTYFNIGAANPPHSEGDVAGYFTCLAANSCYDHVGFYEGLASNASAPGTWTSTVVPIPAAVWLFASSLAGLGFARRRNMRPEVALGLGSMEGGSR